MAQFLKIIFLSCFILVNVVVSVSEAHKQKEPNKNNLLSILQAPPMPPINKLGFETDMIKLATAYEKIKKQREKFDKQKAERKSKADLKEQLERMKVFKERLLASQGGSNVLRDFHTNRF